MEELIKAQEEYIKFLSKEIQKYATYRHYECTEEVYEEGEKLRNEIIKLKNETEN